MGDKVTVDGNDFGFDEVPIGGELVKVGRSKIGHGVDGEYSEVSTASPFPVDLPADQDPIYDCARGTRVIVGDQSAPLILPPAGCKYIRVQSDGDCFVRTDGLAAADDGGSIKLPAGVFEAIPVSAGVQVTTIGPAGTVVRAMPMKAR